MTDQATTTIQPASIVDRLTANADALAQAYARVAELEAERGRLYVEARDGEPRVTMRELASIYGLTEGAVVKKLNRTREAS